MTRIIVGVILAILLFGLLLKVIKFAVIIALCVGIVMVAQNKLGTKRIR